MLSGETMLRHEKVDTNDYLVDNIWFMETDIKHFFRLLAPFSEEELQEAGKFFFTEYLRKKDLFCQEGQVCQKVAFVKHGILRSFFTNGDMESTTFFQVPHSIAVALKSFVEKKPAQENIQALLDTEIIAILRNDLYQLYAGNWKWQQVGRMVIESYYIKQEQRMLMIQSVSAKERYQQFLRSYPEVIRKIPLHYVASYLGISPETLSRIRRSI